MARRHDPELWTVPDVWQGQVAIILAGGPSLALADLSFLPCSDVKVIAINRSIEIAPWADIHFSADAKFQRHYKGIVSEFQGITVTTSHIEVVPGAKYLRWHRPGTALGGVLASALSKDKSELRGACSGALSLNLAYLFGFNPIILVGYDFLPGDKGESHWHEGYHWESNGLTKGLWKNTYKPAIERMAPILRKDNVSIINTNFNSALQCFPFMTLEDALMGNQVHE